MKKIITVVLVFILMVVVYIAGQQEAKFSYESELEKLSLQYNELNLKGTTSNPDFYYGEAYIISQDEMPNGMISVSWCVNYSEIQCFITYEPDYLDEEYPYLLTMYSNGTKNTLDDEVAVIWQAIR